MAQRIGVIRSKKRGLAMSFSNVADVTTAVDNGQTWSQFFYKATALTASNRYADLSWGSGTPTYNSYAASPLAFTPNINTNNRFIYTGPTPPDGQQKYLQSWQMRMAKTNTAHSSTYFLMDVLGFYAAIDCDSTDLQEMDNTQVISRYTSGEGVHICAVTTLSTSGATNATIEYTNSANEIKSVTTSLIPSTTGSVPICASSDITIDGGQALLVSLAAGDKGVKNIRSIQLTTTIGGLIALLLVRPMASLVAVSFAPTEKDFILQQGVAMPEVLPGAALTIFSHEFGSASGVPITGQLNFVWG